MLKKITSRLVRILVCLVAVLVIVSVTVPPALADGKGRNRKSGKRVVAKKKVAKKAPLKELAPVVDIFGPVEMNNQPGVWELSVTFRFLKLTSQPIRQSGGKAIPLEKDGITMAPAFKDQKDQVMAEEVIRELKTKEAFFISAGGSTSKSAVSTIAMRKDSWTEADIEIVRRLIIKLLTPKQVPTIGIYRDRKPLMAVVDIVGSNPL